MLEVHDALRRDVVGAGPLERLLRIPGVTDVLVNGPFQVYVDRGGGLELSDVTFPDDDAVRRLAQRLAAMPERSRDLVQACVQLGVAYVALGQRDTALGRFKQALARDPGLKLSPAEYSPKVLGVFEDARREARPASSGETGTETQPSTPMLATWRECIMSAAVLASSATRSKTSASPVCPRAT